MARTIESGIRGPLYRSSGVSIVPTAAQYAKGSLYDGVLEAQLTSTAAMQKADANLRTNIVRDIAELRYRIEPPNPRWAALFFVDLYSLSDGRQKY